MTFLRVRGYAAAAVTAAVLAVPASASAAPAPAAPPRITMVRLPARTVREPGRLAVIVRSSGCITHVIARTWSGTASQGSANTPARNSGRYFRLLLPFPPSKARGWWYLTNVTALRCGTHPTAANPWNVEWDGFQPFKVLPPKK